MKRTVVAVIGFAAIAGVVGTARAESFELGKGKKVLAPITYQNLTLYPVVTTKKKPSKKRYTVLDEGIKSGDVKVEEKDRNGSVNELTIVNKSDDPLFLMAGEVIIGGKQDRIIGKNTIVPANKKQQVPVFCVEHGRWSGRKASFESSGSLAHTKLRKKASFENQSEVWKEVKVKNAARSEDNNTDTYRNIATGKRTKKAVKGYKKHFAKKLGKVDGRDKMVGFVVAVAGDVVAIETFGSPTLYNKFEDKLLRSYYVEAVDVATPKKKPKPPSAKAIKAFAKKAKSAKKKARSVLKSGENTTYQYDDDELKGSAVKAADEAEPAYEADFK